MWGCFMRLKVGGASVEEKVVLSGGRCLKGGKPRKSSRTFVVCQKWWKQLKPSSLSRVAGSVIEGWGSSPLWSCPSFVIS